MDYSSVEAYERKLAKWTEEFPKETKKGLIQAKPMLVKDIRSNYLSGQVLKRRTGNLKGSVFAEVEMDNDAPVLGVGADAQSRAGFYYGNYWETHGRAFVAPSMRKNLKAIEQLILDQIMKSYQAGRV